MSDLLRHGVVLVVLVSPPRSAHATSNAVQYDLEGTVGLDVPC